MSRSPSRAGSSRSGATSLKASEPRVRRSGKIGDGRSAGGEPSRLSGGGFVSAFLDDRGHVEIDKLVRHLAISKSQLAETVGLRQDVLYRKARIEARRPQARIGEMLEIVGRLVDWAGGERQALAWYRAEPLPSFGGRTAEALVKEGRAAAVRDYLDRIATGGFA